MRTYCVVHAVAINEEGKYLITKRGKGKSIGEWRPVAGFIEERESAEEGALRELQEETNLTGSILKTTKPFWVDSSDKRWVVIASLIKVDREDSIKIDKKEIMDYKWVNTNSPLIKKASVLERTLQELSII